MRRVLVVGTCGACSESQRCNHDEEREPVQAEACDAAELMKRHAGEQRAEDPRDVELDRVQRDRVRQVLLPHQRRDQRLIRRPAERLRAAAHERQREHVPDVHLSGERRAPASAKADVIWTNCEASSSLRRSRRSATTPPISVNRRIGSSPEERVEGEVRRRVRQLEDQPALGDLLHPRADAGRARAHPEHAEVAVAERGRDASQRAGMLADATGAASGVGLAVSSEAVDGEAEGAVTRAGTPTAGPTAGILSAFAARSGAAPRWRGMIGVMTSADNRPARLRGG